jgi:hypothetical protein
MRRHKAGTGIGIGRELNRRMDVRGLMDWTYGHKDVTRLKIVDGKGVEGGIGYQFVNGEALVEFMNCFQFIYA